MSITARATDQVLNTILTGLRLYRWHVFNTITACTAIWTLLRWLRTSRRRLRTTRLQGPASESFLYGVNKRTFLAEGASATYEAWAKEYGSVYTIPSTLGSEMVVLCDPKAIAHYYAKETWTYVHTPGGKARRAGLLGKGLLWAEGEEHKRQRRSLNPGFSNASIRRLTPIFYDSAYKVKRAWDILIESSNEDAALIDVQNWMNHMSLDAIGIAAFSHNFGALDGKHTSIAEVFDTFSASPGSSFLSTGILLLTEVFPFLASLPTSRSKLLRKLGATMEEISNVLLDRTRKEMDMGVTPNEGKEKSIIGLLIEGANTESAFHLTKEEVMAQMKVLLIAGYETTAISLTWALLELSRNPDVQTKLRNELLEYGADPTYDQFTNDLPYLDAVIHETLRVHPPVAQGIGMAGEDDVIPLSEPVRTKSGTLVDSLTIAKGTMITIAIECINRSVAFWGEDAKCFRPSRWLEDALGKNGIPAKAKEIQGHRHLLTFSDGPRICLGKNFAVTEFKAVLTVLVKNFVFELRDGAESKIEMGIGVLPRPKIAGEVGCKIPLRVRTYVGGDH